MFSFIASSSSFFPFLLLLLYCVLFASLVCLSHSRATNESNSHADINRCEINNMKHAFRYSIFDATNILTNDIKDATLFAWIIGWCEQKRKISSNIVCECEWVRVCIACMCLIWAHRFCVYVSRNRLANMKYPCKHFVIIFELLCMHIESISTNSACAKDKDEKLRSVFYLIIADINFLVLNHKIYFVCAQAHAHKNTYMQLSLLVWQFFLIVLDLRQKR